MIIRPQTHPLLTLLALSVTFAMAASAHAQDRHNQGSGGTSVTMEVTFGTTPHWVGIRGTRVMEIREGERPGYDMFRYGRIYYVYNNNRWYMSRRWRGRFTAIDDRSVPGQLFRVPREHWRNYPQGWENKKGTPPGLEKKGGTPPGLEKKNRNPRPNSNDQGDSRDRSSQPTNDRGHK